MQIDFIKVICILAAVSSNSKYSDDLYMRKHIHFVSCVLLVLGGLLWDNGLLYVYLIVGVVLGHIYLVIIHRYCEKYSTSAEQKLKEDRDYYKSIAGSYVVKYDNLMKEFQNSRKTQQDCNSSMRVLVDSLYIMYSKGSLEQDFKDNIDTIMNILNQPTIVYPDKGFNMFSELKTVHDYDMAIKVLNKFRKHYYFGKGFDVELDFYCRVLEEGKNHVGDRIHKK